MPPPVNECSGDFTTVGSYGGDIWQPFGDNPICSDAFRFSNFLTQTFAIGQLGEGHRQILIPAGETSQPEAALITRDATTELPVGKKADQL
jgi:hypothetical protein